jgi:hypothetical protein
MGGGLTSMNGGLSPMLNLDELGKTDAGHRLLRV